MGETRERIPPRNAIVEFMSDPGNKPVRVGILWQRGGEWHGGGIYRENLARILRDRPETTPIVVLRYEDEVAGLDPEFASLERVVIEPAFQRLVAEQARYQAAAAPVVTAPGRRWWRRGGQVAAPPAGPPPVRPGLGQALALIGAEEDIDLFFPVPGLDAAEVSGMGWIPDFQHRFLPENFSEEERLDREKRFGAIARMREVLLSSQDCLSHFRSIYPDSTATVSVWSFYSRLFPSTLALDPEDVRSGYHLPTEFFLVANQFWRHKDHAVVLEAMALMKERGGSPHVVFTGALRDKRGEAHIDHFLQTVQRRGLHEEVRVLGFLPREEQLALMRRSLAVIQPSRFEGWSTVVEDCRALGQRIVLSDLKVHLEQNPPHGQFFPTGDADALAAAIGEITAEAPGTWESTRSAREAAATVALEERSRMAEETFVRIVLGAAERRHRRSEALES